MDECGYVYASLLSGAVTKQLRRKGCITPYRLQSIADGSQGRNWSRDHGEMLLTELFSLFPKATQYQLPRGSITHYGLGPSTSIVNQENAPQACLQVGGMGDIFSTEVLSIQLTPAVLGGQMG